MSSAAEAPKSTTAPERLKALHQKLLLIRDEVAQTILHVEEELCARADACHGEGGEHGQ